MRIRDWSSDVCSADLTSIGNDRHFERLSSGLEEARAKGATIETVNPAGEDFSGTNARKMPLHIVRDATDDMIVMQEEIFGPILLVRRYDTIDGAIGEVNRRARAEERRAGKECVSKGRYRGGAERTKNKDKRKAGI